MIGSNSHDGRGDAALRAELSLRRLQPRLDEVWDSCCADVAIRESFERRLAQNWRALFENLFELYGDQYDFFYWLEQVLRTAAQSWAERPASLRAVDERRLHDPDWFLSERMVGGALYVDLFS
ncbi:MAG: amylosucrase, partial [Planctomycetales bacterium]|nr:amylosucrase [Planctomycetales bacterium]